MAHVLVAGRPPAGGAQSVLPDDLRATTLPTDDLHRREGRALDADGILVLQPEEARSYFLAALAVEKIINPVMRDTPIVVHVPEDAPRPAFFRLLDQFNEEGMLRQRAEDLFRVARNEVEIVEAMRDGLAAKAEAETRRTGPAPALRVSDLDAATLGTVDGINAAGRAPRAGALTIAVFMSAATDNPERLSLARTVGAVFADEGWNAVYGASNVGAMNAFAAGVHAGGGHLTGVTVPKLLGQLIPGAPDASGRGGERLDAEGLKRLDRLVLVDEIKDRIQDQLRRSDALVVLPGGVGTFEELAYVLELKREKPQEFGNKQILLVGDFWQQGARLLERDGFKAGRDFQSVPDEAGLRHALRDLAASRPEFAVDAAPPPPAMPRPRRGPGLRG